MVRLARLLQAQLLILYVWARLGSIHGLSQSVNRPPPNQGTITISGSSHSTHPSPQVAVPVSNRRQALSQFIAGLAVATTSLDSVLAAVTDETDNFADNWWSSSPSTPSASSSPSITNTPSDEVTIRIPKADLLQSNSGLGLELRDIEFRTNLRVYVKSVNGLARRLGVQPDWIIVRVNQQSAERTNAEGVVRMIQAAMKSNDSDDSISLTFRDPSIFQSKLQALQPDESVTTQVAPAGDTTQRNRDGSVKQGRVETSQSDQQVSVTQLVAPPMCRRGATTDDLLEISYVGRILETGQIFDGSAVKINDKGIPGRGNDVTIFFVLNKQPFGQFPPGWDVGLYGMCVGERRRLVIPPALAYGANGVPRRNIPPNATLQYDVSLVSLNGLSTPQ